MTSIVDTNVILVANGKHSGISAECVAACALRLKAIMDGQRFALDGGFEILKEYQNKTQPKTGNGPGDAFLKWVLRNYANLKHCDLVPLTKAASGGYTSFPNDPALAQFDQSDRKFVAVAAAHKDKPPILQAADSKWRGWEPGLNRNGITVEFLCPKDIHRFRAAKSKNA